MRAFIHTRTIAVLAVIVIGVFAAAYFRSSGPAIAPPIVVSYICNDHNTIVATYRNGESTPPAHEGEPPVPGGSVSLVLSDGRAMTLAQTISADGVRYANADDSFVFWEKGNGALVLENDVEKSYTGCVAVAPAPAGVSLPQVYLDSTTGYSIRLPAGYAIDPAYQYQELGPNQFISGTKFTIPPAVASGTNLAIDSYVSVEELPDTPECAAPLFIEAATSSIFTEGGTTYSLATSTGAGAGNRYEERVYALPGTNPCIAVRYFVHYGVLENYPEGAVRAFDRAALIKEFDTIRDTLTVR